RQDRTHHSSSSGLPGIRSPALSRLPANNQEHRFVKRIIVLSSLVTSAVWFVIGGLAVGLAFPAVVDAQGSRIAADSVVVQTPGVSKSHPGLLIPQARRAVNAPNGAPDGAGIVLLGPPPDNNVRGNITFGGSAAMPSQANVGLNFNYENGSQMLRLGT